MSKYISFAETKKFNEIMDAFEIKPYKQVEKRIRKLTDKTITALSKYTEIGNNMTKKTEKVKN
jgi:hypothetical protein